MFGSLLSHRLLLWEIPLVWKCLAPFSQVVTLENTSALDVFCSLFTGCYSGKYLCSGSSLAPFSQVATLGNPSSLEMFSSLLTDCYAGKYLCTRSVWLPFHKLLLWEIPVLWKCLAPFSQVATLENTSALEVFGSLFTGCYSGKYLCSGSFWVPFHRLLLWEIHLLWKCLTAFSQVATLRNTSTPEVFGSLFTGRYSGKHLCSGSVWLQSHRLLFWKIPLLWKCLAPFSQVATLENHSALEMFGSLLTGRYSGKYLCSGSVWLPFHRLLLWETPLLWKCLWLYPRLRSMKDIYIL